MGLPEISRGRDGGVEDIGIVMPGIGQAESSDVLFVVYDIVIIGDA